MTDPFSGAGDIPAPEPYLEKEDARMANESNSWKQMFRFTKDGKLQSLTFMYAFFLGIAILFLNFLISNRVAILFEGWLSGTDRHLLNLFDILVPAVLCAVIVIPIFYLIKKKRIVLFGYWFAFLVALIFLIAVAVMYDADVREILLPSFVGIFIVPAAAGTAVATLLFLLWRKKNPDPVLEEQVQFSKEDSGAEDPVKPV